MKFGAGRSVLRLEDDRLLRGRGRFVDDMAGEGALHMALLRSIHAHADIRSIDLAAAKAKPGVVAAISCADLEADGVKPIPILRRYRDLQGRVMTTPPHWLLARERVRYVGEALAAIVAVSRQVAEDALEDIVVDVEELDAITDFDAAKNGSPIWPEAGSNSVAVERFGNPADVEIAIRNAAYVVELRIRNQRIFAAPLEPRSAFAEPEHDTGRIVLHTGSQNPTAVLEYLTEHVLGWSSERLRIMVPDIGGGFGMKGYLYPEDALVTYFASRLTRSVKWTATRTEDFLGATHARDQQTDATLALDERGRILGLRVRTLGNLGAYPSPSGPLVALALGAKVITNVYDIPHVDIEAVGMLTNTQATGPYRGAGRPEAIFIIERLLDEAAVRLGLDQIEMRLRNLVRPDQIPYKTATGETYDSGDFPALLERAVSEADWHGFDVRARKSAAQGLLRGRGLSLFIEWTGGHAYQETVRVSIQGNGSIVVESATQPMGQGLETTFAQMVAATFEMEPQNIRIVTGNTDLARGFGSFGSRSLFVGGSAVALGARSALEAGRKRAAEHLEAAVEDIVYENAVFRVTGTDRWVGLFELAAASAGAEISITFTNTVASGSWPNGAHVCEIEIDPDTGEVRVDRYTCVDDVGVVVNPMIVEGQIHGGIAQGVGQALLEEVLYEAGSGQLLTASFQDYAMPRAGDLPAICSVTDERWPCRTNPLGSKGAGESGAVGSPPAVIAAILDALRPLGVRDIEMPATATRIWRAIQDSKGSTRDRDDVHQEGNGYDVNCKT